MAANLAIAYILLFTTGIFGGHRYYIGARFSAVVYACTLGFLLLGVVADLYYLPGLVRKHNFLAKFDGHVPFPAKRRPLGVAIAIQVREQQQQYRVPLPVISRVWQQQLQRNQRRQL